MNALYCRNCGASVRLEQSAEEFLASFGGEATAQDCTYELLGPVQPRRMVLAPGMLVPEVECACGAKGPFGSGGPITDEEPGEICPACKQPTLEAESEWIT